jgi:uncharacterized protein (DUF488 family)
MMDEPVQNILLAMTIGHSTHDLETFSKHLGKHAVTLVVDIRTIPRSRHNPQFNRDTLPNELKQFHIRYIHMPGLGGLRKAAANSPNMGWRNASFRGFADYMQTGEFEENLVNLIDLASRERLVLMCAEALPWRCHRSLIADALLIRRVRVEHILTDGKGYSHTLTPWARVRGIYLTYPPES